MQTNGSWRVPALLTAAIISGACPSTSEEAQRGDADGWIAPGETDGADGAKDGSVGVDAPDAAGPDGVDGSPDSGGSPDAAGDAVSRTDAAGDDATPDDAAGDASGPAALDAVAPGDNTGAQDGGGEDAWGCPPEGCDDGDPCTVDSCDAEACVHTALACDDGDACTVDGCQLTVEGACPEGLHAGDACLVAVHAPSGVTWGEAAAQCVQSGGMLATISSSERNEQVREVAFTVCGVEPLWIGASDASVEGTWVWMDGSPVTYSQWATGEPDDSGDYAGVSAAGAWFDDSLLVARACFVCEVPASKAAASATCVHTPKSCDDGDTCTRESCMPATGACVSYPAPTPEPQIYLFETFAGEPDWLLGPGWQVAPAKASSGHSFGNPDPATDWSAGGDNGVAGVSVGGNEPSSPTAMAYLTSPAVDTSGAAEGVYLHLRRWLNTPGAPYTSHAIEVHDGAVWHTVWESAAPVADTGWVLRSYDLTAYKSGAMRVRFGFRVDQAGGATASGWNLDDVVVSNTPSWYVLMHEPFVDNGAGWTLGPEWEIGPAASSAPPGSWGDPAADVSPGPGEGLAGMVIGGPAGTEPHPFYYLTSKGFDATGAAGALHLQFHRWLVSDYAPWVENVVEVFDGSAWYTVWKSGGPPEVLDKVWTHQSFDVTAYQGEPFRVRFGSAVNGDGATSLPGWSIDEVLVIGDDCK